ncbi:MULTISPECIES: hypothetical protein [unclassified Comamonas]|uniref:hypothetical protein n=1 Tax=unclassified Comamonas TaxID=2638500 RepID=UPI0003954DF4|nr:hypothetical protein [Comamonas sp. B-9]
MLRSLRFSTLVLLLAAMAMPPESAWAARKKNTEATQASKKPAKARVKVKRQRSSSAETLAERDRRLLRECKGLPNAGACLGYAKSP